MGFDTVALEQMKLTRRLAEWSRLREERINRVKGQLIRLGIEPEDLVAMIKDSDNL